MSANLNDIFWLNLSKEMLSETFFSLAHFIKCGTVSKEGNRLIITCCASEEGE